MILPGVNVIMPFSISTLHRASSGHGPLSFCVTTGINPSPLHGIHFNWCIPLTSPPYTIHHILDTYHHYLWSFPHLLLHSFRSHFEINIYVGVVDTPLSYDVITIITSRRWYWLMIHNIIIIPMLSQSVIQHVLHVLPWQRLILGMIIC